MKIYILSSADYIHNDYELTVRSPMVYKNKDDAIRDMFNQFITDVNVGKVNIGGNRKEVESYFDELNDPSCFFEDDAASYWDDEYECQYRITEQEIG